jgi:hypothetical protein
VSGWCTSDSAFRILIFDWGKWRLGLEGVQNPKHIVCKIKELTYQNHMKL